MTDPATPDALRIIGNDMQANGVNFRTDAQGIEGLVLINAADEIDRLREQVLALQHIAYRDEERLERMRTYIVQLESAIIHLERVIFRLEGK